jgi:hypothetical protein
MSDILIRWIVALGGVILGLIIAYFSPWNEEGRKR